MKFSITIPAYKAKFLKECIDSILSQTYKDFELIIVNDASPEDLGSIVNGYSDSRIRYYKNDKNCGAINVVDNWNKCLGYAQGEFIICMGDDDKLMPNCLEEYDRLIAKYPQLDAFHARVIRIDDDSNIIDILEDRAEEESVYSLMRHRFCGRLQYIGDFCYRVSKLRKLGGFFKLPMAWGADDATSYMMSYPLGIANTNKAAFMYRVNRQTISNTGNNKIKMDALNQEEQWLTGFVKRMQPESLEDREEKKLLFALMQQSLDSQKAIIVCSSCQKSLFAVIYWIKYRKKYKLPFKCILKGIKLSLTV